MRADAIDEANRAIRSAERDLSHLKNAKNLEEAEHYWGHFLESVYQIYEKLNAGATGTQSWHWYARKVEFREKDELLRYLHAARNCKTHRLEKINAEQRQTFLTAPGGIVMMNAQYKDGKLTHDPLEPAVPGEKITLVDRIIFAAIPVTNRNPRTRKLETHDVPRLHKGSVINKLYESIHPLFLGNLALAYARDLVAEASDLR
ncbi:hypothetical protein E5675_18680 [Sphingopyxis sp. PAMC25046]|uniref:hypothetical protein n=1 Tax=Sphingopyxis sp. PAMC25046 TaxID=2565556 RepID=UPI00109E1EB8|nr:hypothetical protein [Sphingopyxis sp. PAMC25046]QCB56262.1 hypothetical protein E5675_18680 [Sphingopyxis sp. PAMC25046]